MKSNYFKYIFVVFVAIILIFAIVKMKKDEKSKEEKEYKTTEETTQEEIKEIKLGVVSFDSINPILSKNKNIQDISKIIFEPLVTLTSDFRKENCLAKEIAKQNETTYIIKLRDDKKWSNGEKFTADDVKFTIDRIKENDTIYSSNIQNIQETEIIDENTIRIILNEEVPFFEYNLTFPILLSSYYSDKEFIPDIVPVGTGIYKVASVEDSAIILEKNEYYKNVDKFKLEKITITTYSTVGELYNAFKMGSVDLVSTQNSNLKDYIGTIGYLAKEKKGREHDFLVLNTETPILNDKSVRQAINYSIDKSNIVSSMFGDKYYVSSFPLDYGNWLYSDEENTNYNLEQAKQILVEDGWTYSYRYWQKTVEYRTQRISLNMVVKASDEIRVQVAENIKAQLENQGFRINLIKANDVQYAEFLTNKNYDIILCSMNLSVSPNLNTFFGENNLANYSNEEVTKIMNEIKNQTDEEKLKENYKKLSEIYKNDVPYISLFNNKYIFAYNGALAGVQEPNWFYQFYNIDNWHK